jgi:hypothetical protein
MTTMTASRPAAGDERPAALTVLTAGLVQLLPHAAAR